MNPTSPPPQHTAWPTLLLLLALMTLGLSGCAAQNAYREGQRQVAEGQLGDALQQFEQAARLEPGSAEYRIAVRRTRDRLVAQEVALAVQARDAGRLDSAEQALRRAQAIDPSSDAAAQGQRQIEQLRRWDRAVRGAEMAAARQDWPQLRALLKPLQAEVPEHPRLRALLRQADEATARGAGSAAADPAVAAELALAAAFRKPISIEFRDTALKTIFEVISRTSGLNFVFDKDVRADQKASIFLKSSSIEAAVGMLLLSNQLEQRVLDANSVLIYPNTPAKQKDYQPLTVRSFYLANADAKTVAATLKTLLKLRDAVVDEKLNLVIVRDSPAAIRVAEKIVALHDVPEAEVMLEVEILEIKRTRLLDLGVRWPDQLSLTPLASSSGSALTLADLRNLNSASIGATLGPGSINARKTDTDANLLANPRIRARNREKAKIHIGERVPNITTTSTSTGFVAESVTYVDVGLKLDVEPTIYLDNEVAIRVALEVSNIISQIQTKSGTLAYQIGTRTASTMLRLKDGENQVLAGLISDEDRRSANKVPGLGEAPVLGRLFGNQADDSAKTEIVLSITPRVLRNLQRPDATAQEFDSGTETSTGGGRGPATPATLPSLSAPGNRGATPAASGAAASTGAAASGSGSSTSTSTTTTGTGAVALAGSVLGPAGTVGARWVSSGSASVGDTVTVQLFASSDQPVSALPLVIALDPKVVQMVGISEGSFLRQGGAATRFGSSYDNNGQLVVSASRIGGTATGTTAEAQLLSLSLKLLARPASGDTLVQLVSLAPIDLQGRPLAVQLPAALVLTVKP